MTYSAKGLSVVFTAGAFLLSGCLAQSAAAQPTLAGPPPRVAYPLMGTIERFDPALENILPAYAVVEKIAEGFEWSEGPVWVPASRSLLFSDVPRNVVYRWHELAGTRILLEPSGYTADNRRGGEPGSNGLALDPQGRLVLCQHGDRRVARLEPDGSFTALAAYYKYMRFNSPNDLTYRSNGDLYFTDPPYGLEKGNDDPAKELLFNGVFRVRPTGKVELITDELTFPNGIALSPDETRLYVAVSDPQRPVIMMYPLAADGLPAGPGRVFFDAKPLADQGRKGLPDGLKVDLQGNLFATGPGGVMVLSPEGKLLGLINTGEATANCGWGNDGSVLYITADMFVCRVKTWTRGFVPRVRK